MTPLLHHALIYRHCIDTKRHEELLTEEEVEILRLHNLQTSHREIAEKLGITHCRVRTAVSKARGRGLKVAKNKRLAATR